MKTINSNTGRCATLCLCLKRKVGEKCRPLDLMTLQRSVHIRYLNQFQYIYTHTCSGYFFHMVFTICLDVMYIFHLCMHSSRSSYFKACIGTKYMKFVPVLILKLSHYVCASNAYISQRTFFLEKFINVFSTVSQSMELN